MFGSTGSGGGLMAVSATAIGLLTAALSTVGFLSYATLVGFTPTPARPVDVAFFLFLYVLAGSFAAWDRMTDAFTQY